MYTFSDIKQYSKKIAKQFKPEKIILFGSAAKNRQQNNSDVDLMVIMEYKGRGVEQAFLIRKSIPATFPLDIIVRKPEQISKRLEAGDFFIEDIILEGVVLYERTG
jgi:predicted nucleotidyltransferase